MKKLVLYLLFTTVLFAESTWVDGLLSEMSLEEKIGQLFIIPGCPLREEQHKKDLIKLISDQHIGGIILKQSDPITQMKFVQELQKDAQIPLLIAQDAEWGLGMRMTKTISFPKNLTLGAIPESEEHLLYQLGREIGRELRIMGSHINFAPVVDVNNNPDNPIIHMRSFGEDPENVSRKALKVMKGMQMEGILACAKHYPGHGDTAVDSHVDLPVIEASKERLEEVELYPFQRLIDEKVDMIMSAHILCHSLNEHPAQLPASLSKTILHDLLREKMGFEGLVITDALNMKALTKTYSPQKVALLAHTSKNDILLYGDHLSEAVDWILYSDVPKAIEALKSAYWEGRLNEKELDKTVKRILVTKNKVYAQHSTSSEAIESKLNSNDAIQLKKRLYKSAMTLLKDKEGLIPINLSKISYVRVGKEAEDWLERIWKPEALKEVDQESDQPLLVSIYPTSKENRQRVASYLRSLQRPVVLIVFDSPYTLKDLEGFSTVLLAYETDMKAQTSAFKVLSGKIKSKGRLPVNVSKEYRMGQGI